MIQLNLLPDVKEKYIKTERLKRMVFGGSLLAVFAAVAIAGILTMSLFAQKARLSSLDKSIKTSSAKITGTKDLDKILTVQNQLNSLTALHDQKPVTSRLFDYLPQITPNDVSITNFDIGLDQTTGTQNISITGTTKSLEATNKFVDTLKFTKFSIDGSDTQTPAFSKVVLTSFSSSNGSASYIITMEYDPALFTSDSKNIKLIVPKQVTTQSTTQRPDPLFQSTESGGQTP